MPLNRKTISPIHSRAGPTLAPLPQQSINVTKDISSSPAGMAKFSVLDDSRQAPDRCLAAIHYYGKTNDND